MYQLFHLLFAKSTSYIYIYNYCNSKFYNNIHNNQQHNTSNVTRLFKHQNNLFNKLNSHLIVFITLFIGRKACFKWLWLNFPYCAREIEAGIFHSCQNIVSFHICTKNHFPGKTFSVIELWEELFCKFSPGCAEKIIILKVESASLSEAKSFHRSS